jgi:hypothetical protein
MGSLIALANESLRIPGLQILAARWLDIDERIVASRRVIVLWSEAAVYIALGSINAGVRNSGQRSLGRAGVFGHRVGCG